MAEAVTPQKVRRLRRLAGLWLATQSVRWSAVRLDVIGVRMPSGMQPDLIHLEGVG